MGLTAAQDRDASGLAQAAGLERGHVLMPMRTAPTVADATQKWWVVHRRTSRRSHVLILASRLEPRAMQDVADRQRRIIARLGDRTASVILTPTQLGTVDGRSFALFSYRQPLSQGRLRGRWQRWRLRRPVLAWLNDAVAETAGQATGADLQRRFLEPLWTLSQDLKLDERLREGADEAVDAAVAGRWRPFSTVAHNDLWLDNVLLAPGAVSGGYGFVIIDWGLANPYGQPFYDLMRLAGSLRLRPASLRHAIDAHCAALACSRHDAMRYLLAGLGWLRQNLNEFPHERFVQTANRCVSRLEQAVPEVKSTTRPVIAVR